jgi:hypothetical protein
MSSEGVCPCIAAVLLLCYDEVLWLRCCFRSCGDQALAYVLQDPKSGVRCLPTHRSQGKLYRVSTFFTHRKQRICYVAFDNAGGLQCNNKMIGTRMVDFAGSRSLTCRMGAL